MPRKVNTGVGPSHLVGLERQTKRSEHGTSNRDAVSTGGRTSRTERQEVIEVVEQAADGVVNPENSFDHIGDRIKNEWS